MYLSAFFLISLAQNPHLLTMLFFTSTPPSVLVLAPPHRNTTPGPLRDALLSPFSKASPSPPYPTFWCAAAYIPLHASLSRNSLLAGFALVFLLGCWLDRYIVWFLCFVVEDVHVIWLEQMVVVCWCCGYGCGQFGGVLKVNVEENSSAKFYMANQLVCKQFFPT